MPQHFDRALREVLFKRGEIGQFEVDLPDLIEATTTRLISLGHTRRGGAASLNT